MQYLKILLFVCLGYSEIIFAQNNRLDSLQKILLNQPSDTQKVNILADIAYILEDSRPDTSLIIAQQALQLAQDLNSGKGILKSSFRVAYAYQALGKYELALDYYFQHLKLSENQNDWQRIGRSYYAIGFINKVMGKFQNSVKFMHQAHQAYQKIQDKQGLTRCLNALGELSDTLGNRRQAREYFQKSLELAQQIQNVRATVFAYLNLAKIDVRENQFALAEANYQKILALSTDLTYVYPQLQARNALATLYMTQAQWQNAQNVLLPALNYRQHKDVMVLGEVKESYFKLSNIYQKQNDFQKAFAYLKTGNFLQDSLFQAQKLKDFAKIQAQFDWEKQQQKITLLEKQKSLDNIQLQQKLYVLLGFIAFLLPVIIGLAYGNRLKRQNTNLLKQKNNELTQQKAEIASQAEKLQNANIQIQKTNLSLSEALQELAFLNEELENKVIERTHNLQQKNQQLAEYAFLNAHKLRAPLTTMLGLVGLLREQNLPNDALELLAMLQKTGCSLDQVIHQIQKSIEDIEGSEDDLA
ncbi:MAG: tetratricopeptide repeat protein [Microscillaceae bacterium]|jgi:tetratricopeptide (TPR) repeat protein|nr:tetratricopeptide repeat protein [Microscillaceae bacterium]